jgi:hypothetical protein
MRIAGRAPALTADSQRAGTQPAALSGGNLTVGFQARAPAHVSVSVVDARGAESRRELALLPGLTWYTTPALRWPAEARLHATHAADAAAVRLAAAFAVNAAPAATEENLERSATGTVWPLLTAVVREHPDAGTLTVETWYSYLGPREGASRAQLREAEEPWRFGHLPIPTTIHLGPGNQTWRAELRLGQPPVQEASDGRQLAVDVPPWTPAQRPGWVWLEIGPHRDVSLHEPPLFAIDTTASRARLVSVIPVPAVLPLLAEPVAEPVLIDGTLVKGSGDDLFYVDDGHLRWVQSLEAIERHRIPWRLTVLDDLALGRLPVSLPLT